MKRWFDCLCLGFLLQETLTTARGTLTTGRTTLTIPRDTNNTKRHWQQRETLTTARDTDNVKRDTDNGKRHWQQQERCWQWQERRWQRCERHWRWWERRWRLLHYFWCLLPNYKCLLGYSQWPLRYCQCLLCCGPWSFTRAFTIKEFLITECCCCCNKLLIELYASRVSVIWNCICLKSCYPGRISIISKNSKRLNHPYNEGEKSLTSSNEEIKWLSVSRVSRKLSYVAMIIV